MRGFTEKRRVCIVAKTRKNGSAFVSSLTLWQLKRQTHRDRVRLRIQLWEFGHTVLVLRLLARGEPGHRGRSTEQRKSTRLMAGKQPRERGGDQQMGTTSLL